MTVREEMQKLADDFHAQKKAEKIAKTENWIKEELNYIREQAKIGFYNMWLKVPDDLDLSLVTKRFKEMGFSCEFSYRQIKVKWESIQK